MDNYSKIYDKELEQQMKEINESINGSIGIVYEQAQVISKTINESGIFEIIDQISNTIDNIMPSINNAVGYTSKIGEMINDQMTRLSISSLMQDNITSCILSVNKLQSQFDFTKFAENIIIQESDDTDRIEKLESFAKKLDQTLHAIDAYTTYENWDIDNVGHTNHNSSEPRKYIVSDEERNEACSVIKSIIYDHDSVVLKIEDKKGFYEQHPILCQILIGVLINILAAIAMTAPSYIMKATTKNINATVKESLDEPQKEKTKLPPGTSVIIVDETTPRYYEVEYTDPETGERKCGYVAKQCVIKNENIHEERVGD